MADRPLLIFPTPTKIPKRRKGGGKSEVVLPTPERQGERLQPMFERLEQAFESQRARLADDPTGFEVEQILVIETVGAVDDFYKAVKGIPGLEWLGDFDTKEIEVDEEFRRPAGHDASAKPVLPGDDDQDWLLPFSPLPDQHHRDGTQDQPDTLSGRVYLIMFNQEGLSQLLSLYRQFLSNPEKPEFARGRTKWRDLFQHVKAIRPWGIQDRLHETGLLEDWEERVALGEETLEVEVELAFKQDRAKQEQASIALHNLVRSVGGEVLSEACIPAIYYHALLVRLPISTVAQIVRQEETTLTQCGQVMFFRPAGQAIAPLIGGEPTADPEASDLGLPSGTPVVALFDGLPLVHHERLTGRFQLDDPDDWAPLYPAESRLHGTGMASLIARGDLDAAELPLTRPVYVRPILRPDIRSGSRDERIPPNTLPVDLIHRAVRRLFVSSGDEPAVAPGVKIINLSVCDNARLFDRFPSPWARLLDYLAWEHQVLFLVSAGNHATSIELATPREGFRSLRSDRERLEREVLQALNRQARYRRLRAPAESINALSIGSVHSDLSVIAEPLLAGGYVVDPLTATGLPSPFNAQGLGFRRSVKPDLLFPGGRLAYREKVGTHPNAILQPVAAGDEPRRHPPGQKVATVGAAAGDLTSTSYTCGTSNATALATRTAARFYDLLEALRDAPGGDQLSDGYAAVLLKALLVHGASWGDVGRIVERHLGAQHKDVVTRLLGYGVVDPERVFRCTEQRATAIGCGSLGDGEGHRFSLPALDCLNGKDVWCRWVITLAWLTPINSDHRAYRSADLWFSLTGARREVRVSRQMSLFDEGDDLSTDADVSLAEGEYSDLLKVSRQDVHWQTARRGTLQHEVLEGEGRSVYGEGDELRIEVTCRADAGDLKVPIPYALVVTLEVAPTTSLPVYQEMQAIRPKVAIR